MKRAGRGVLIALGVLLVLAAIALGVFYGLRRSAGGGGGGGGGEPIKPPKECVPSYPVGTARIEPEARKFYCRCSTEGLLGRSVDGGLWEGPEETKQLLEAGLTSPEDLARYPLTYAMGHPYWASTSFGALRTSNWTGFTRCFGPEARLSSQIESSGVGGVGSGGGVLVIENGVVVLDLPKLSVVGLVVRHNGILLVQGGMDVEIRTQFVLIESGGLLQAGSTFHPDFRFPNRLELILTHPPAGYSAMGALSSQYSYEVYNPGVRRSEPPLQTAYTGLATSYDNMFGAKVVAVGFNGNLVLAGVIGTPVQYLRNWNVVDEKGNEWLEPEDSLTSFKTPAEAALQDIQFAYPMSWCRVKNEKFLKGSNSITVDERDTAGIAHWKPGDEVVLSGKSAQFTVFGDPQGMIPFWVNNQDPEQATANEEANRKFVARFNRSYGGGAPIPDKSNGVEVQTIQSISSGKITFTKPLKFDHDSRWTEIDRSEAPAARDGKIARKIYVGTCTHIGLLSHNIRISSELTSGGSGANVFGEGAQAQGQWRGPGGKLVCNSSEVAAGAEIYAKCYASRTDTNAKYCNNERPPQTQNGSWVCGTAGKQGSNAIFGGHQFFRLGSSVTLDGIELKYMSTPANFGNIGTYAVHFHLAGWPRDFHGYLPATTEFGVAKPEFTRDATFANSSNWLSFSRWVTLHGTHNVSVRNNVCFVSYGSGLFVEDGVEINNTFEHNLCLMTLLCDNEYYNPAKLAANASSDIAAAAMIWLKNSQNRVIRNVLASGPSPVAGVWQVPQLIGALRGASAVCLGDPVRKLPALASSACALGEQTAVLSQRGNNWQSVKDAIGLKTPCWMPDDLLVNRTYAGQKTHCPTYSARNDFNPYSLNVDNVFYNLLTGLTEFPEAVAAPTADFNGVGGFNAVRGQSYKNSLVGFETGPQWLPFSAQNSCTDDQDASGGIYTESNWGGRDPDFPFQPLSPEFLLDYDTNVRGTVSWKSKGATLPKILSGFLSFNLGSAGPLVGGAFWIKQGPVQCFGCAFIETSHRLQVADSPLWVDARKSPPWSTSASNRDTITNATFDPASTALAQCSVVGDDKDRLASIYSVFSNCLFNGGLAPASNPSVFRGRRIFFGDRVTLIATEYNDGVGASNHMYFHSTPAGPRALIAEAVWQNRDPGIRKIALIDFEHGEFLGINGPGRTQTQPGTLPFPLATPIPRVNVRKFPYVCGADGNLFRTADAISGQDFASQNPDWLGIVANAALGSPFAAASGITLGDAVCQELAMIQPDLVIPELAGGAQNQS